MRKLILIFLLLLLKNTLYSQVSVIIDSLYVSWIVDEIPPEYVYVEGVGQGPYIWLDVRFKNESNDTLFIEGIMDVEGTRSFLAHFMEASERIGLHKTLKLDHFTLLFDMLYSVHKPTGYYYKFRYRGKEYYRYPRSSFYPSCVKLYPYSETKIIISDRIFLGTDILKPMGYSYGKECIEVLPTLQIIFRTKDGTLYNSNGIQNVYAMDVY